MDRRRKHSAESKAKHTSVFSNRDHINFYNYLWREGKGGFHIEPFLQNSTKKDLLFSDLFAYWDLPKTLLKMITQGEKYDFFLFVFVDSHKEGIILAERESKKIDGSEFRIYRQGDQTIDTSNSNFRNLLEKVFSDKYLERAKYDIAFKELFMPSKPA